MNVLRNVADAVSIERTHLHLVFQRYTVHDSDSPEVTARTNVITDDPPNLHGWFSSGLARGSQLRGHTKPTWRQFEPDPTSAKALAKKSGTKRPWNTLYHTGFDSDRGF
ncbi:hypothetical protein DPEC_G00251980 [Dallia pectoralis]|uniref:Uncharacterized protein n=1 Tax=Dallia pectoralis TaxID=75939 RepID=A0ACC2FTJ5_DALPE|nr:hypothetical protein DPEC_G00251980 [Dallia pectoralis]